MEMSRQDVIKRGGTNRKQSGSAKSKKGMLKKLGLSDEKMKSSFEFPPPDLENEFSMKISKLPKRNLKDSNGMDHASVPRKLRSAMKKRNLESVSKLLSVSKRLNRSKTGIESFKKDLVKKENQEMEAIAIGPDSMVISKDEKEVAETLYGLAGMFTETDKKNCVSLPDEKDTSKSDTTLVAEADLPKPELLKPVVSVLSLAKTNHFDEMPLDQSDNKLVSKGLMESSSVNLNDAPPRANEAKVATGLALWPGLFLNCHSGAHVSSKPSSTTIPLWMGQAASPSKAAPVLSEPLRVQPRKLKRCASHINICHFIKELQTRKSSPTTLNQIEQRSSELSERRLPDPVTTTSDFKTTVYPSKRYQNPHLLDIHRTHNPKPVQEDMTKLALEHYGPHMSQKQSYDFLSLLSAGATQSQFLLQNSFPQYQISASHSGQLSPATSSHQVQQRSPYQASRFQTAYNANQQQQQQLQKRLWAAQYRPTNGSTMPSNQYSNKPNLSLNLTSIQPLQVASSPRYNNNVSQQHRLMATAAAMSMSHHHNNNPSRAAMNRQEHHYPLIYEDTRTPLQLLCNEQS